MRIAIALALVAACGDNRGPLDAPTAQPPGDAALLACEPTYGRNISVRRIVYGCNEMGAPPYPKCIASVGILVTAPPDDSRLFAIEQAGAVRIITDTGLVDAPFLDISEDAGGPVWAAGELGFLGLAFHPDYATNRKLYVDYTRHNPDTTDTHNPVLDTVVEFTRSADDPDKIDPTSARTVLAIPDFASNHNAGMIEFGSDGYLYVATGDGGGAGDPDRNGQNTHALLAKILRIDVDHPSGGKPYGIPADNPFADGVAGAPEVWLYGVRNPWRWTFDRKTGDMWIADVGQNQIEELDVLDAGHQAGTNLGWSVYEGDRCCASPESDKCSQDGTVQQPCDPTGIVMPAWQITHEDHWGAIIGGQVYRGPCYPDLDGTYFFVDNDNTTLTTARRQPDGSLAVEMLPGQWPTSPSSIHADARGELYETNVPGGIWHIEAH
jgi:glucose/arabinose dehydrogenase